MRISDWSSDVCSSDLPVAASERSPNSPPPDQAPAIPAAAPRKPPAPDSQRTAHPPHPPRSEEHTSELQSLMRTSYAVFCLKKKTKNIRISDTKHTRNHIIPITPPQHT